MGRLQWLSDLIEEALAFLGLTLPPWVVPLAALALILSLLPLLRRNHRTGLARRRVQRLPHLAAEERRRVEAEVLRLVAGNPEGLLVVGEEAMKRGRRSLAEAAAAALEELEPGGNRQRRLRRSLEGDGPATALEARLLVERFLDTGLLEEARRRLERARSRWPGEDWSELEARLAAPEE